MIDDYDRYEAAVNAQAAVNVRDSVIAKQREEIAELRALLGEARVWLTRIVGLTLSGSRVSGILERIDAALRVR